MLTAPLTLQVDAEAVRAFEAAPAEEQDKLILLINAWLTRPATPNPSSLKEVMHEIGQKAQSQGLTPEILESILQED